MDEATAQTDPVIVKLHCIKKEYAEKTLLWYKKKRKFPGVCFRLVGIVIIILSLSIPYLSAAGDELLSIGVPIASLIIAVFTALNSFFAWQTMWEKRVRGQHALEGLIAVWETKMVDAEHFADSKERYRKAIDATQELVNATRELMETGTNLFFANLKFPDAARLPKSDIEDKPA